MIKNKSIFFCLMFLVFAGVVCCSTYPLKQPEFEPKAKYKEADYVNAYCKGIVEYELPDKTRIDCLTDDYAIEFDYAKKWAESIGQSLYYAKMTGKKPAVGIIIKKPTDRIYIERIKKVDKDIKIFVIKSIGCK
jgi:hypothetical protein